MSNEVTFKYVTIILLGLLSIITTLINSICIYIIAKSKVLLQRPSTYFILNLLTVHLIQGLIVFPFYAAKKAKVGSLEWGKIICDGFRFTYMLTYYCAIYGVLLIGLDRVLATIWVWRYRELVTKRRVLASVTFVWIYIIALCLIPFGNTETKNPSIKLPNTNRTFKTTLHNNTINYFTNFAKQHNQTKNITEKVSCAYRQSSLWTILMLVCNCIVPYVIIILCYQMIIYKINRMDKRSRSMTSYSVTNKHASRQSSDLEQKNNTCENKVIIVMNGEDIKKHKRITHLAMILSIAYFFFWSPSVIYFILWSVCPSSCFTTGYKDSDAENYIGFITKYLAFLDALAAPLIYCFYHEEFRKLIPCKKFRKKDASVSLNAYVTGRTNSTFAHHETFD